MKCERGSTDRRSLRPSTTEIEKLRVLVSSLRDTLRKVNEIAISGDSNGLAEIKELLLEEHKEGSTSKKLPVSIGASNGGSFSIFGPTSAFSNVVDMSSNSSSAALFNAGLMALSSLMTCLSNFFKWQYPDIAMFIHRESFLNDFLTPLSNHAYCSEELVYAIAALGAKCSKDETLRKLSLSFFEASRTKIFSKKICNPQINTLQALLCLALYELGDGNASASWMLSGMAIRMGYDLGFQLNPRDWTITDLESSTSQQDIITNMDVMVRSRIYWGCYVFDHFVSLVMGRPVTVRKSEASIPSSEHLPNSENIEDFIFHGPKGEGHVDNLDASTALSRLCTLSELVSSLLSDIFSSGSGGEGSAYLTSSKLDRYNKSLEEWRSQLPSGMRWTKRSLLKELYNPTVQQFRLFYFVVLICLNKPFLTSKPEALTLCNVGVSELATCLSKFNQSEYPASVLVLYSSILGVSVILTKAYAKDEGPSISDSDLHDLQVFYATISQACLSWKLASKSLIFIKKRVSELDLPAISRIFDTNETPQDNLTQSEVDEILELGGDPSWGMQDNFFANFFEFLNDDDLGRMS